jgi:hypothetical protein
MHPPERSPAFHLPALHQKERRHHRFNLQFPVSLSFPSEGAVRELAAISENVSIGGLLLKASDPVSPHTQVKLTMEVKGPWSQRPVRLVARGEVVRLEPLGSGGGFAIAVECRQLITEIKGHLRAAS